VFVQNRGSNTWTVDEYIYIYIYSHVSGFTWLIIVGFVFDDWIYWHFFTITVDYNSSHIELILNDVCLTNLSDWFLLSNSRINSLLYLPRGPDRRHHVEQLILLCCPVSCHGNLVFSNFLPGNDSFVAIRCNENVISEPLLSNGLLALAPLFRLSAVTSQYICIIFTVSARQSVRPSCSLMD
jgi:hypothetical protein